MANTKVKAEQLEAAQTNITSLGTLTALTVDDITIDGSTISDGGDLTIDVTGNLILDADGGEFKFQDGGTDFARIFQSSGNFYLNVPTQDTDLIIQGNDGGSNVNALTFDMSDAGAATFSNTVTIPKLLTLNNPASVQAKFNPNNNSFAALAEFYNGTSTSNPFVVGQGYASGTDNIAYVWNRANAALLFGTNNTEKMRIDSAGKVSINIATATAYLDVRAPNGVAGPRVAFFHSINHNLGVAIDVGSTYTNIQTNNNSYPLTINATGGNVSIGSSSVAFPSGTGLQVYSSGNPRIKLANSTTGVASGDGTQFYLDGADVIYDNKDAGNQRWYTGGAERMRIDSSGRLLIGTTSHASGYSTPGGNSGENAHYSKLWIQGNTYATTGDGRITLSSGTSWPANNTAIGQIFFSTAWGGDHAAISCYTGGAVGNTDYPGELRFYTTQDGTSTLAQAMSIRQHGTVHIGPSAVTTDSNYAALVVRDNNVNRSSDSTFYLSSGGTADWTARIGGSYEYALRVDTTSSASYAIGVVADSSTWKFRVNGAGDIYAVNTTVQSISDRRLKENITDAKSQWDDIKALKWKNFNWTKESGHDDGKPKLGLIADEVEKVSPNLINIDAQPKEDIDAGKEDPEYKTVKYSIVWMKAMKALQEAMERIEVLESEVKTLKGG